MVWDNLILSSKHRYERKGDHYSQTNRDWIRDRIDASHMKSMKGVTIKKVEDLNISDMVASKAELDYVFGSLVAHYSSRLVQRHPEIFKSLNSSIRQSKPHQFSKEMELKSTEFTGTLFTKSESRMEDLIDMMFDVQKKHRNL